jgi:GTPase SAR1 family protein
MIVGNKKDLVDQRVVEMTDGAKFALENGNYFLFIHLAILECLFMECSAESGENIEEIFSKITQTIIYKIDSGEIPDDLV